MLAFLLWIFVPTITATAATRPDARLVVEVDGGGRAPYPQEMVLVRIHGFYRVPITLEKLVAPEISGARVLQIGPDHWADTTYEGLPTREFRRTMALFPQRSGEIVVPPFVHRLTIVDGKGRRAEVGVASEPVAFAVRPAPADAGAWWLPARDVTLSAAWSLPPGSLRIGQAAELRLTVTAHGVTDDQLPPPPNLTVPGLIVFSGAPERKTVIAAAPPPVAGEQRRQTQRLARPGRLAVVEGEDGPIATVVWRWSIRPATSEPVDLPDIVIPWLDAGTGETRTAVLPGARVALADGGVMRQDLERRLRLVAEAPAASARPAGPGLVAGVFAMALAIGGLLRATLRHRSSVSGPVAVARWLAAAARLRLLEAASRLVRGAVAPTRLWVAADRAALHAAGLGRSDRRPILVRDRASEAVYGPE